MASNKQGTSRDYVPFGSERHMALLGLRKAEKGDEGVYDVCEGYCLADPTPFLAMDPTGRLAKITLHQKVSELTAPPVKVQSEDPTRPGYAPEMWRPDEAETSGIV